MPATHTGPRVQIRVEILLLVTARVRSQAPQWYEFSDGAGLGMGMEESPRCKSCSHPRTEP